MKYAGIDGNKIRGVDEISVRQNTRVRHQSVTWTGVLLRRVDYSAADESVRQPDLQMVAESTFKAQGWHRSRPSGVFARCRPFRTAAATDSGADLTSLGKITNVCGDDRRLSFASVECRCEELAKHGLPAISSLTSHPEADSRGPVAWFTLNDAQIRPSGSFGFAAGSRMPQYEVGRADSQGGLQSFRS